MKNTKFTIGKIENFENNIVAELVIKDPSIKTTQDTVYFNLVEKEEDKKPKKYLSISINQYTMMTIFGYSLLSCISDAIDSTFSFDKIYDKDDKSILFIRKLILLCKNPGIAFARRNKEKILIRHQFSISDERLTENKIAIKLSFKFGFCNLPTDDVKLFTIPEEYDIIIKLDIKEALELFTYVSAVSGTK